MDGLMDDGWKDDEIIHHIKNFIYILKNDIYVLVKVYCTTHYFCPPCFFTRHVSLISRCSLAESVSTVPLCRVPHPSHCFHSFGKGATAFFRAELTLGDGRNNYNAALNQTMQLISTIFWCKRLNVEPKMIHISCRPVFICFPFSHYPAEMVLIKLKPDTQASSLSLSLSVYHFLSLFQRCWVSNK